MLGLFVSRGMGPDPGLRPPPSADQLPTSVHLSFAMSCIHCRIHVIQRGSEPREQLSPFWISRGGVGQAPGTSTKTRCYPVLCLCPPGSGLLWYSRISFNEWGRGAKPPKKTSGCCCTSSSSPATSISCRDSASLRSFFRCSLHLRDVHAYDIWGDSSPALLQDCQRKQGRDFRSTTKQGDDFALENPAVLYLPKIATRSGVEGRSPRRNFRGLLLAIFILA